MKWKLLIILMFCVSIGCSPDTYGGMKEIDKKGREADEAELRGDYSAAIERVKEAERIARDIDWREGVVSAKLRLGAIYIAVGNNEDAEREMLEVKALCLDINCYDSVYSRLVNIYLSSRKPQKALAIAIELSENHRGIYPADALRARVDGLAQQINNAGYPEEAEKLSSSALKR